MKLGKAIQIMKRQNHWRPSTRKKELSPLEKAKIAQECREFCDAPFGKGLKFCETLEYDLADYNREIDEMKRHLPKEQPIPGKCMKCKSRQYKRCGISDMRVDIPGFIPNCTHHKYGTTITVKNEAET